MSSLPHTNPYTTLGLPTPVSPAPPHAPETLKKAFHRRLLECHPDKQSLSPSSHTQNGHERNTNGQANARGGALYTVDDIKAAYAVLSDDTKRREWDVAYSKRKTLSSPGGIDGDEEFILGLEVLDLEDFSCSSSVSPSTNSSSSPSTSPPESEDGLQIWTRPCRCGEERGFRVTEMELEDAVQREEAEVLVGCVGCSLWCRVGFGVVDDEG